MAQLTSMLLNGDREPPTSASAGAASREGLQPHPRDPVRPSGSAAAGALAPPGRRSGTGDSLATSEVHPPALCPRLIWAPHQIHLDVLCVHRSEYGEP